LAGGAELVAAVEVEDILDVMLNDGVEIESVRGRGRLERRRGFKAGGQGEIVGADGSVAGFEQGGFKDGGKLAHVSGPVVLQEAGQRAGAHEDRALLIARADAVEQGLASGEMSSRRRRSGGMEKRTAVRRKARSGSKRPCAAIWRSEVAKMPARRHGPAGGPGAL